MKLSRSNRQVGKYGGLVPILKRIEQCRIAPLITSELGNRVAQAKYCHADNILGWGMTAFCGGKRLNYISKVEKELKMIVGLNVPSHDTLGRGLKKLAIRDSLFVNREKRKTTYTFYNDNLPMNRLLVKVTKRIGALSEGVPYTVDIDATYLETECKEAFRRGEEENDRELENELPKKKENKKKGRKKIGFSPMVALIGNLPIGCSLRSGNAAPGFQIKEFTENTISILEESQIKVGRVISDAAGYTVDLFKFLDSKNIKFIVRFPYKPGFKRFEKALCNYNEWRETKIPTAKGILKGDIGEIEYNMYDRKKNIPGSEMRRVVVFRRALVKPATEKEIKLSKKAKKYEKLIAKKYKSYEEKDHPDGWIKIGEYSYKLIITSDFEKTSEDIIIEYNKRGAAERQFAHMKKDFAWKYPPFMRMNENAVFVIAAAIANNLYRGVAMWLKSKIPQITLKSTLEEFIHLFIRVSFEIIEKNNYAYFNTEIPFDKIKF